MEEDLPPEMLFGFGQILPLLCPCVSTSAKWESDWITFKGSFHSQVLSPLSFLTLGIWVAQEARKLLLLNSKGVKLDRFGREEID